MTSLWPTMRNGLVDGRGDSCVSQCNTVCTGINWTVLIGKSADSRTILPLSHIADLIADLIAGRKKNLGLGCKKNTISSTLHFIGNKSIHSPDVLSVYSLLQKPYIYIYVYMYICRYIYIYTCIYIYIHTYTYVHIHIHRFIYISIDVHIKNIEAQSFTQSSEEDRARAWNVSRGRHLRWGPVGEAQGGGFSMKIQENSWVFSMNYMEIRKKKTATQWGFDPVSRF